jgi:uncharacterized protein (TIGR03382 family)
MMVYRDLALAMTLVASGCAVDKTATATHAIIGGDASGPSEFAATGMLVNKEQLLCTATLIAPDVALTAAHCLEEPAFGTLGFTLDTDGSDGTSDVVPVTIYHRHPDFDDGVNEFVDLAVRNDIGILILKEPIQDIIPEQLDTPSFETAIDAGNQLAVCGYGRILWTGSLTLKRDAEVVVDRAEAFEFSTTATDPQPCTGDSGAPLFVDGPSGRRIVGVVSRAVGTSRMCDTGAIITRVAPYAAWIAAASKDRDPGCSAGGGGSVLPLGVLCALHALRRRRTPR